MVLHLLDPAAAKPACQLCCLCTYAGLRWRLCTFKLTFGVFCCQIGGVLSLQSTLLNSTKRGSSYGRNAQFLLHH